MKRRALLAVSAAAWGAAGCTLAPDQDFDEADAPQEQALVPRPRLAWVFSSGGPRGFTHVGVLKALHEMRLQPDLLVGASIGSMVCVLYAAIGAQRLYELAMDVEPQVLLRVAFNSPGGERLWGGALADLVHEHHAGRLLERLSPRVACVAAMVDSGRTVAWTAGDAGLAVQASAAIEGTFAPVRIRGRRYVDADLHQPLPVRLARQLGAQRVVAIDASAHEDRAPVGSERYRAGDLRKRALTRPDAQLSDVLLHPYFDYYVSLSRSFRERAMRAGYEAALAQADRLRALHSG